MDKRFSRQAFLGTNSDRVLEKVAVAIVGLGGGGSHIVQQLSHIGVGDFLLIDPDVIEESNLNRLVGATREDVANNRPKTTIAERAIRNISPEAKIVSFQRNWNEVADHLRDRDVIFGCVDTFKDRRELEIASRRAMVPYIDIGMDVHEEEKSFRISGQVILSLPGQPCMKCLSFLSEDKLAREAARYGSAGARPQVVWPNGILASFAVGVFIQLLTPWHNSHSQTIYLDYDGNDLTVRKCHRLNELHLIHCPCFLDPTNLGDPFWD